MIRLSYKQLQDVYYLSSRYGGKPVEIETVPQRHMSGYRTYAYIGKDTWHVPKRGEPRVIKDD